MTDAPTKETQNIWPDRLMIRDTGLHDDMGGGGQRIYTTAGRGYELREYVRADVAKGQHEVAGAIRSAIRETGQDSTEAYYAEMEAARNVAEDAYFKARPQLMRTIAEQCLFRAGFERAWASLWHFDRPAGAP